MNYYVFDIFNEFEHSGIPTQAPAKGSSRRKRATAAEKEDMTPEERDKPYGCDGE